MVVRYSYCEGAYATSYSRWHIRELTEQGKMLSGGVDTPSLCGMVRAGWGWDLETEVRQEDSNSICRKCSALYKRRLSREKT
jgi:hypothetical protein